MKKFNKILAIASVVMFVSCVRGVSPRAVKYNEKGGPVLEELTVKFSDINKQSK